MYWTEILFSIYKPLNSRHLKQTHLAPEPGPELVPGQSLIASTSLVPLLMDNIIGPESNRVVKVWVELGQQRPRWLMVSSILYCSEAGHCHRDLITERQSRFKRSCRYLISMSSVWSMVSKIKYWLSTWSFRARKFTFTFWNTFESLLKCSSTSACRCTDATKR